MDKLNVLSFSEKFHPTKEQQYTIRLHDHGLLRLIPISAEKEFFQATNKIFFNTLLTSHVYEELFFDHFSQKSDGKHGPFLLSSLNVSDFVPITNDHLKQETIQKSRAIVSDVEHLKEWSRNAYPYLCAVAYGLAEQHHATILRHVATDNLDKIPECIHTDIVNELQQEHTEA